MDTCQQKPSSNNSALRGDRPQDELKQLVAIAEDLSFETPRFLPIAIDLHLLLDDLAWTKVEVRFIDIRGAASFLAQA